MATKKPDEPTLADLGIPDEEKINVNETVTEHEAPTAGATPRKRGRPAGSASAASTSRPKKSQSRKAEDVDALAKQIQGIHVLASMATGLPELGISEVEAKMLANGITAVTEEYGFAIDGKAGAALQLFGAAAMVYVPRFMMVQKRANEAKKAAAENGDSNIVDVNFNQPANVNHSAN